MRKTLGIFLLIAGLLMIFSLSDTAVGEDLTITVGDEEDSKIFTRELALGDVYWQDITSSSEPIDVFLFVSINDVVLHMDGYGAENGMLMESSVTGPVYWEIEVTEELDVLSPDGTYYIVWSSSDGVLADSIVTYTDGIETAFIDSDGDDIPDDIDDFPDDPTEWLDSDLDGVGDNADAYPNDATRWELEVEPTAESEDSPFLGVALTIAVIGSVIIIRKRTR